jgi:hypothetical protein
MIDITTNNSDTYIYVENKKDCIIKYIPKANCLISSSIPYYPNDRKLLKNTTINILKLESSTPEKSHEIKNISLPIDYFASIENAKTVSPNNKYLAVLADSGTIKIYSLICSANNIPEHKEMNINFNSYESNLSTEILSDLKITYNTFIYKIDIISFSPDSEKLIVLSDEYLTLLSRENNDSWKVCSQLFMPIGQEVESEDRITAIQCYSNFNITDDKITIATLNEIEYTTKNPKYDYYKRDDYNYQIQVYSADITDVTSTCEFKQTSRINLKYSPSTIQLSPDNKFLLARLGKFLDIYSKNNRNLWIQHQEVINTAERYEKILCWNYFDTPANTLFEINGNANRLAFRLGVDYLQIYALIDNKWEHVEINLNKVYFNYISKIAISKDGRYIALSEDYKGRTAIFKETTKKGNIIYVCTKLIRPKNRQCATLDSAFNEDQQFILSQFYGHASIHNREDKPSKFTSFMKRLTCSID